MYQEPDPQCGKTVPNNDEQEQPEMQPETKNQYYPRPQMHAPLYTIAGFRNLPKKKQKQICLIFFAFLVAIVSLTLSDRNPVLWMMKLTRG
ncbi:hypothetical protein GEMRC1_010635 [Eukaryota sp. GEM-RC1]